MKNNFAVKIGTILLIGMIGVTFWAGGRLESQPEKASQDPPTIDSALLMKSMESDSLDYMIIFEEQADLTPAFSMPWEERGQFVYEALTTHAEQTQADVVGFLDQNDVSYKSFWIQNVIAVESSTSTTLKGLLDYYEIEALTTVPQILLEEPIIDPTAKSILETPTVTQNLVHIRADEVWAEGMTGTGMVVGSIDTGVRFTHEALVSGYRGNLGSSAFEHDHNWWDAVNGEPVPYDDQGHGSHTTGIMVGEDAEGNIVGAAPGAEWIACKAISASGSGLGWDFLECGQFMLAPWDSNRQNANPDLRPQVVNNSWGSCGQTYIDWFEDTIDAWQAAGIYPVFSNGNAGNCGYGSPPGLNTVGNPARSYHVTSVGSTGTADGIYANHSNWGPTDSEDTLNPSDYPWIKPQVVAPGVGIRSAVASGDGDYGNWGGTSMSAPHVSGLVALMWEAGDCLIGDYASTETLIQESAVPIPYATGNGDEGPGNVPNHATGWGEIDALDAVRNAQAFCGTALKGGVYDALTGQSIRGAVLEAAAEGESGEQIRDETDENGQYRLLLKDDENYTITVTAEGFYPVSESGISAPVGENAASKDFHLTPDDTLVTVSGVVTDGSGHGYPLYANILIQSEQFQTQVYTNPFDGTFKVVLHQNMSYELTISPLIPGYQTVADPGVLFTSSSATRDYAIAVDENCDAPGYAPSSESGVRSSIENNGASTCLAKPGGVAAGFVTHADNGEALNGAEITGADLTAIAVSTPDDPDLADGFYWLFQPVSASSEDIRLKIAKPFFLAETTDIELTQGEISRVDVSLRPVTVLILEILTYLWSLIENFFRF